ncbi:MAG: DUF3795 domain-containing protein [Candidatus Bipolaricaulota bacterium]|nr:DUF3795 domain-containing protein [Candidatus Bipolaricaulota bacterium]
MTQPEAAICGDWCGKCPNYPSDCAGCRPELHKDCRFVRCALDRGLEHCGLCPKLPCEKLKAFVPDDRRGCPPGYHVENLRRRAKIGTEAWLAEQRKAWSERGASPQPSP